VVPLLHPPGSKMRESSSPFLCPAGPLFPWEHLRFVLLMGLFSGFSLLEVSPSSDSRCYCFSKTLYAIQPYGSVETPFLLVNSIRFMRLFLLFVKLHFRRLFVGHSDFLPFCPPLLGISLSPPLSHSSLHYTVSKCTLVFFVPVFVFPSSLSLPKVFIFFFFTFLRSGWGVFKFSPPSSSSGMFGFVLTCSSH